MYNKLSYVFLSFENVFFYDFSCEFSPKALLGDTDGYTQLSMSDVNGGDTQAGCAVKQNGDMDCWFVRFLVFSKNSFRL
jgi:hypothetical protein